MKICKSRLVPNMVYTSGDWFLQMLVPINICNSRLVPTNMCNSWLVHTKYYKEKLWGFLPKGFTRKSCVPCSIVNRIDM
jgi:hypothetical protein